MSNFWANPNMDPKRSFLFRLNIGGIPAFLVMSAERPSYDLTAIKANYLNIEFNFPGRLSWKPIKCTIRETLDSNAVSMLKEILINSGYDLMQEGVSVTDYTKSISRKKAIKALQGDKGKGAVLTQIDADGKPIDTWTLINAWISNIEFSGLSYDEEKISDMSLTIVYDYATVNTTII